MTALTPEAVRAILEGCDGVTPGPYKVRSHQRNETMFFVEAPPLAGSGQGIELLGEDTGSWYPLDMKRKDAAHIARLDPATVAALCSDNLAMREALAKVKHTLLIPAAEYVPAIADAWEIIDAALEEKP